MQKAGDGMLADFYRSKEYEQFRAIVIGERLERDGDIICDHCGQPIDQKYDCITHHLVELTETNYRDPAVSLNPELIALVHHKCHNAIHEKTGYKQPKVYIIWGAPLSGKSSYVESVAKYGDLILDMDKLWQAVSGRAEYEKPNRIKENVFGLRDELLRQVAQRRGYWKTAYVIGGYPLPAERERLAVRLSAECIHIDTSKEECMARLARSSDGRNKSEWEKYISDWFATFERFTLPPVGATTLAGGGL